MAKKKYSFINEVYESICKSADVTRKGEVRIKRADVKAAIESAFIDGAKHAAGGERIRFPVIGALVRKEVKARKAGKGVNPFTGEAIDIKARPASKKPRWCFPTLAEGNLRQQEAW